MAAETNNRVFGPMTNDAGTVSLTYDFPFVRDTDSGVFHGRIWIFHSFETLTTVFVCDRLRWKCCCTSFDAFLYKYFDRALILRKKRKEL